MNVWQAVASALKAEKTEFVFGLPGGDLFFDSLLDIPEIKPILVREETAGPFMAMGYARVSGKPGICYAPSGPGVAHLAHVVGFSLGFLYAWARYRRTTTVRRPVTAGEGDSQP